MTPFTQSLFIQTLLARLLLGLFLAAGIISYQSMSREHAPDLEIPQALVKVSWPGAAPEQVEKEVTKKLEDEIRSLKGIKKFHSGSYNSFAILAVEFDADMPVTEAMARLRAAIDKAESEFPSQEGIKKPELEEMSAAEMPAVSWVLHGEVDDLVLTDTAKRLQNAFEAIPTVKKVDLGGLREKSLHIRLKPHKLRELGISPLQVQERISSANRDMAWGEFEGSDSLFFLYLAGRFDRVEQVMRLPIARLGDNRPVRLSEIAEVGLQLDREKSRTFFSLGTAPYTRGITLDVTKRPGADAFEVIAATEALVAQFTGSESWPRGLSLESVFDLGELIEQSFDETFNSLYLAVLVVFVLLMFLLTWREALIAGLAIPVTLFATLAVLNVLGYTFSTVAMIGMVLALGLLVDVFILVMEGMHEGIYVKHLSFAESATTTVRSFLLPAIAGQLTTILAMVPLMAVGGIDGKFIRILPVTITIALTISLVIAFLVCIPLSRFLLEQEVGAKHELLIDRISERFRRALSAWLERGPLRSKTQASLWVGGAIVIFLLSLVAASTLPVLMYEESEDRRIGVAIELGPNATLEQAQQIADKAGNYIRHEPWIEKTIAYVGQKSPITQRALKDALLPSQAYHQVGFTLILVPREERPKLAFEYFDQLRAGLRHALADEAGVELYLTYFGGRPNPTVPVQIELKGTDYGELRKISLDVRQQLARVPGAVDIRDNLGVPLREIRFSFIPERLSFHQLTEQNVVRQIRMWMAEDEYGHFKWRGLQDDPKIRFSMQWPSRSNKPGSPRHISEIELMDVISPSGDPVPLLALVNFTIVETPQVYVHTNGHRTVTVQSRAEGQSAMNIMLSLDPQLQAMKSTWPTGYDYRLAGEMESTGEGYGQMGQALLAAVLLIFVVLTLMFNSMSQPIIILLTVPLAVAGSLLGFFLSGMSLSFLGMIGVVALAGITVNTGIVLVETMNSHLRAGEPVAKAAARGAGDRLRPIVSTSLTTILGLVPLALSDPQWHPICMAIIYGLSASTLFSLAVVPALYLLLTPETTTTTPVNETGPQHHSYAMEHKV
jgi:multidrug efflux pump subunit AcrB